MSNFNILYYILTIFKNYEKLNYNFFLFYKNLETL